MAKDTVFPDDKLGWKPHPDARSVLDEFRQVTMGLEFSTAQLRGEQLDGVGSARAGRPTTTSRRRAPRWSARWKPRSRFRIRSWKSLPRRCSSAGSVTRPSITASSSPTTAPSASSRRSAASPRRRRVLRATGSAVGPNASRGVQVQHVVRTSFGKARRKEILHDPITTVADSGTCADTRSGRRGCADGRRQALGREPVHGHRGAHYDEPGRH